MNDLTPMQAACWFGRDANSVFLGGVSAHLYTEFNTRTLDLHQLEWALQRLYREHAILRMILCQDGQANIQEIPNTPSPILEIEDLKELTEQAKQERLLQKRNEWTHQRLELNRGQVIRFSASLIDLDRFRLHIDSDMIAVDPSSFRLIMEDLAQFYFDIESEFTNVPSFFDWHAALKNHSEYRKLSTRDRQWWQARLKDIAPAPSLPFIKDASNAAQSHCLHERLSLSELTSIETLARQNTLTLSSLFVGVFAFTLDQFIQDSQFRLNVPTFWRAPVLAETDRCVGDFANFLLLNINKAKHRSLASFTQEIASKMVHLLEHSHYSGVNILRDLSRHHGSTQIAPVVFTAALDLSGGKLFSEKVTQAFGSMDWSISQGPQVALDAQVVRIDNGVLINWDIRLDALELHWVNQVFTTFVKTLKALCHTPDLFDHDCNTLLDTIDGKSSSTHQENQQQTPKEEPLSAIQQAYLLGRTNLLPLGGVAMQEFREYKGHFSLPILRERLNSLIKKHDSLRTYICPDKLTQTVHKKAVANLIEVDLSEMSAQAASVYMDSYRARYTHALFDLDLPPWNITAFKVADEQLVVFARFDALILDGRAIATIMNELFASEDIHSEPLVLEQDEPENDVPREAAREYWCTKLSDIKLAPQIPWRKPLESINDAKFERLNITLDKKVYRQFYKLSAKRGLFKNTAIMSVILEILAYWSKDQFIYTALPVLPLYSGALANRSTFIAVTWEHNQLDLTGKAKHLQNDIHEGLQYLSFSGVDIARQLVEQCNAKPILPVVITNGLSWPTPPKDQTMQLASGLTQTPQIAMDIRFTKKKEGGLIFSIDYVIDALEASAVMSLLEALKTAIHDIVNTQEFHFDASNYLIDRQKKSPGSDKSLPHDDNQTMQDQISRVYSDVIGIQGSKQLDKDTNFMSMGLKPQHFKRIMSSLNDTFSLKMSVKDIIKCRNINEVEHLLKKSI
ncbi:condensation domain-containing protein [Marinomonas mediterranea]|uniref:Glutamate racemase n=1 Tax=Marinomonas mediterranea (strain ATCC 700492 / JCM 21426 / NBRC 103028 / MMB-1) TaxID=717774 RepID=F2JYE0_MARM1|nr:condensation domain-containing protein [Marinomonas mediterranea]ADZ91971.1 Glutamate racemase [Marinomonas mediterranea MMB-1]WCN18050.1 peptide synthetase [Marinomonas mediterranea MMB-1]